ncbi:MAG: hypothetical protein KDN20_05695 [Verrucomicrobiae bacterium]|nr:hypothetical protein [Verrucomicrobiae bacterium]
MNQLVMATLGIFALAVEIGTASEHHEVATIREATGFNGASIQSTVDQLRVDIGGIDNGIAPAGQTSGRREINWDDVPDSNAAPGLLPEKFFNTVLPKGLVLCSGQGLLVSADSSNPTSTPTEFGDINPNYPDNIDPFTGVRVFQPSASNEVIMNFYYPGTTRPAAVCGFGAVFSDVDVSDSTMIEFFAYTGERIFSRSVLATSGDETFSFVGATFENPVIHSVRITCGDATPGANDISDGGGGDVVAMDDVLFGEPTLIPRTLAHTRYRAPGILDTFFAYQSQPAINPNGECLFQSRLTGLGATRGRNQAVFSTLANSDPEVIIQSRVGDAFHNLPPGETPIRIADIINNAPFGSLVVANTSGRGRPQSLFVDNGSLVVKLTGHGDSIDPRFPGAETKAIRDVVGGRVGDVGTFGFPVVFTADSSLANPVDRTNDTGIVVMDQNGNVLNTDAHEGSPPAGLFGGDVYGQFGAPPAICFGDRFAFSNPVRPGFGGRAFPAVFADNVNGGDGQLVALSTQMAPGVGQADYRNFLGVGCSDNQAVYRCTLSGPDANARNNEGIFREGAGLLIQKGQEISPGGPQVKRIQKTWPIGNEQFICQSFLRGPGINQSNSSVLFLGQSDGDFQVLMQTGDPAPGPNPGGAIIRSIQRVDVDPVNGYYVVQAALKNVPPSQNQILCYGQTTLGDDGPNQDERLPNPLIQKGDHLFSTETSGSLIRGIKLDSFPDRTGVCARGKRQVISSNGDLIYGVITDVRECELLSTSLP